MNVFIIHAAISIGLAYIIGRSEITFATRVWLTQRGSIGRWIVSLMQCPVCLGFWIGFLIAFLWPSINPLNGVLPLWKLTVAIFTGLYTSGTNLVLGRVAGLIIPEASADTE